MKSHRTNQSAVSDSSRFQYDISIVIPTYNRAFCVGEAIESCLQQADASVEVIVVDDGSTDETRDILKGFGDRIRLLSQQNSGVSAARNAGILAARGEWIIALDSDDELAEGALEELRTVRARAPALVAIAGNVVFRVGTTLSSTTLFGLRGFDIRSPFRVVEEPLREVLKVQFFLSGLIFRRSSALRAGLFDTGMSLYEDGDFQARLALQGPWAVTPKVIAAVLRKGDKDSNLSVQHRLSPTATPRARSRIFGKLLGAYELSPQLRGWVREEYAHALLSWAEADLLTPDGNLRGDLLFRALEASRRPKVLLKTVTLAVLRRRGLELLETYRKRSGSKGFRRSEQ